MAHKYTEEQIKFIYNNAKGISSKELTHMFNKEFKLNLTVMQLQTFKGNRKIKSGLNCRFEKGHVPDNKGKKGICPKECEKTWFKKGNIPLNHRTVGSERINIYGYSEVKVAEPNKWRLKHQVVWEKHKGSIPKGYNVIFGDSNKRNFDINNLILVSKKQLLIMNRNKLIQKDAELTRTGVIVADIYSKISKRRVKNKV